MTTLITALLSRTWEAMLPLTDTLVRAQIHRIQFWMVCLNSFADKVEYIKKDNDYYIQETQPHITNFPKANQNKRITATI